MIVRWPEPVVSWLTSQWHKRGVWYWLMLPLSGLYTAIIGLNAWLYDRQIRKRAHLPVPVIVVGNLYIGGTGKTPVTIALSKALAAKGYKPGLISRGYGSQPKANPAIGRGADLDWKVFGDEPALIAQRTQMPISVHSDRFEAGQRLLAFDPSVNVIISDDGLQHQNLARDIELLVQDERGLGNGATLPAGPLREASARRTSVDAVLQRGTPVAGHSHSETVPLFVFDVVLEHFYCPASSQTLTVQAMVDRLAAGHAGETSRAVAVAGIGVPERFFQSLRNLQIRLDQTIALSDHAPMTAALLASIGTATILVTEKDAIKYPVHQDARIWVARASVRWPDDQAINWLEGKLRATSAFNPAASN